MVQSGERKPDIHVTAGRIRIGTELMGGIDESLCVRAIQTRKTYFELCRDHCCCSMERGTRGVQSIDPMQVIDLFYQPKSMDEDFVTG
jgi:hypothetical protein